MANDVTRYNDRNRRDMFDDFFDSMLDAWGSYSAKAPAMDVEENDNAFVIKAELPGYTEDDVKIYVDKHVLYIEGNKKEEDESGRKYLIRERRQESFERSFRSAALSKARPSSAMNTGE